MRSLFALCLLFAVRTLAAQGPIPLIPPVHGTLLSGETLDLPTALHGHTAVLVLGFSQSSRAQVAAWGRMLAADYHQSPTVLYYEMPVLAAVPRLLRPFILKQVKASVPDRAKAHCLPVDEHEKDWKRLTGFAHDGDAYILLVDSHGTAQWTTHGDPTAAAYATLKQHVTALKPG